MRCLFQVAKMVAVLTAIVTGTIFLQNPGSFVAFAVPEARAAGEATTYRAPLTLWLKSTNNPTDPTLTKVVYGTSSDIPKTGDIPLFGDWNGDGTDTIGFYRLTDSTFHLKDSNTADAPFVYEFQYGNPGDVPLVGDWDNNGRDSIGVFRKAVCSFKLRNSCSAGSPDISFSFGMKGDIPIVGRWNPNSPDTPGVFRPSRSIFYLRFTNTPGPPNTWFAYGSSRDLPVAGDWTGKGFDSIGVYSGRVSTFKLRNSNASGDPNIIIPLGRSEDIPVVGAWNGSGFDTIGVCRGNTSALYVVSTILFANYNPSVNVQFWRLISPWSPNTEAGWYESISGDAYYFYTPERPIREIKDIMSANIDIVFFEVDGRGFDEALQITLPGYYAWFFQESVRSFFEAYKTLIQQGYTPPKIALWINHELFWPNGGYYQVYRRDLDLSTSEGKTYYYSTFIKPFWQKCFEILGYDADRYVAKRQGKIMISNDAIFPRLKNYSDSFLGNMKVRFQTDSGYGVYWMAHPQAEVAELLNEIDAAHDAFGPGPRYGNPGLELNCHYCSPCCNPMYNTVEKSSGKSVMEILPGFWMADRFLPRQGGAGYEAAWQTALSNRANLSGHLGITSWNYYPEGSPICESKLEPNPYFQHSSHASPPPNQEPYSSVPDVWGPSPRHYIDLTARYAAQWNNIPENDAEFMYQEIPASMVAGQTYSVRIAFRNVGDNKWSGTKDYKLTMLGRFGSNPTGVYIVDTEDEIPKYGGIFRGRPKVFQFPLTAPLTPGRYTLQWRMMQEGVGEFGDYTPPVAVNVVPVP